MRAFAIVACLGLLGACEASADHSGQVAPAGVAAVSPAKPAVPEPEVSKPESPEPEPAARMDVPAPQAATSGLALREDGLQVGEETFDLKGTTLPEAARLALVSSVSSGQGGPLEVAPTVEARKVLQVLETLGDGPRSVALPGGTAVPLVASVAEDAPELHIQGDGFHIAERRGAPPVHLASLDPDAPYDVATLGNKARLFRTGHVEQSEARVRVGRGVTAETLVRALEALRGVECDANPSRCWLPRIAVDAAPRGPGKVRLRSSATPSADASPGTVSLGKARVAAGLDRKKVTEVLRRRLGYARMCYFASLADDPGLEGSVSLSVAVADDGTVRDVSIPSATLKDRGVHKCLTEGVEGLRFAAPTSTPATVDVTLSFAPR